MKSIRSKIIVIITVMAAVSTISMGFISILMSQQSSLSTLSQSMTELANTSAERIQHELISYKNISAETGSLIGMMGTDATAAKQAQILSQKVDQYGFQRGDIFNADGRSVLTGTNASGEEFFKQAMSGNNYITDPVINQETKKVETYICAPIREGGQANGSVVGVVYYVPNENFLNDIAVSVQIGTTGSAYLLKSDGYVIAHKNTSLVLTDNSIKDAQTNKSLEPIASLERRALAGENGFGEYTWDGVKKVEGFAPIAGTNGWAVCVTAEQSEFMVGARTSVIITLIAAVIFLLAGGAIAVAFGNSIGKPLQAAAGRLNLLVTNGDLKTEVPVSNSKDETGRLLHDMEETFQRLRGVVAAVTMHLDAIAKGDLTKTIDKQFAGDFGPMSQALMVILSSLNEAMAGINISSDQVASGSEQVSSGAQALSQGATEQASAVEELAATINEISEQVKNNAENASQADSTVEQVSGEMMESNEKMQQMIAAMAEISESSKEIGKIIKTIEDIAFQTNILALNAAVEAARAGEAGKGFAVVADEVRNLAGKSAEASKNTSAMIEKSIHAVENGTQIADSTAKSLLNVVEGAKQINAKVRDISNASRAQADSIAQVTQGIDQISSVVQTNSATAEESAAASEELSGQAAILKDLVARFKLKAGELKMLP